MCRTCLPPISGFDTCTSCEDGVADLVLYTSKTFGSCLICNGCASCSGVYINTSPDSLSRKCETCALGKYFAYEFESEYGTCTDCHSSLTNCLKCSGYGFCLRCKDGFFLSPKELRCVACKTDCAVCVDSTTCLRSTCFANCKTCSDSTFAGCSECLPGYFKDTAACTSCGANCLACTAANACTNPLQ